VTGGPVESLETPAVVVDLDVMDANIRRGIDRLAGARRAASARTERDGNRFGQLEPSAAEACT
jgi:hypothetical protein